MLKIKNLNKKINDKVILKDINFETDHGQIAVFLGKSGVGKSTLLRVVANLDKIDTGSIYLDGSFVTPRELNKQYKVGMVFQGFNLFEHLTVLQNVTLSLEKVLKKNKKESKSIAEKLLIKYGLESKKNSYVSELSGGQKQRLAIVRTIAMKPKIICLDEPTSALDPMLTNFVSANIQELAKDNFIVLVATHDVAILDKINCTIYLMDEGTILEKCNSKEFFLDRENYPFVNSFLMGK